jgi:hypothetical protein
MPLIVSQHSERRFFASRTLEFPPKKKGHGCVIEGISLGRISEMPFRSFQEINVLEFDRRNDQGLKSNQRDFDATEQKAISLIPHDSL